MQAKLEWLGDVGTFQVNRLPAHSDHMAQLPRDKKGTTSLRQNLNGEWLFNYAERPDRRPARFFEKGFDCSNWDRITVPGHIQMQGYGKPAYLNTTYPWDGSEAIEWAKIPENNPVGSYVLKFTPDRMDMRAHISFQGVDTAFYAWLNGEFLGYSEDGCTPSEFDISGILVDGENTLCVEVYKYATSSWLEDQDFFRFSGIFRDVFIEYLPEVHIDDVHVTTDLADDFKSAVTKVHLKLSGAVDGARVWTALDEDSGRPMGRADAKVVDGECSFEIPVEGMKLWSAEEPNLYLLTMHVEKADGTMTEIVRQTVGYRRFEIKDKIMLLNGKRIVFKGANRHDFDASVGRAVTDDIRRRDLVTMKRNNINAVRTCHYPNGSSLYELSDTLGLYVIDEANLETHGTWGFGSDPERVLPGSHMEWLGAVLDRAKSMYERDKNHPSILIWSCGNESSCGEVIYQESEYFRTVDPTRIVHYEGVNRNPEWLKTTDVFSQMYTAPEGCEQYLNSNPERPMILCEYMHSMGNSTGGMKSYTDLTEKYPMYQGGFIWDFIDQAVETTSMSGKPRFGYGGDSDERPHDGNFSGNGIVFADGSESPKMQDVKHLYANVKLIPDEHGVTIRNENLFVCTRRYAAKWSLKKNGETVRIGSFSPAVMPESEEYFPLDVQAKGDGEWTLEVSLVTRAATEWAESGFEIAHGQHVWGAYMGHTPESTASKMIVGKDWAGVEVGANRAMFSKKSGLESLVVEGKEMIKGAVKPTFWRAMTDNDIGAKAPMTQSYWKMATDCGGQLSVFGMGDAPTFDASTSSVGMNYTLKLPDGVSFSFERGMDFRAMMAKLAESDKVKISYRSEGGKLHVEMTWDGKTGLPDIPNFALRFKLPLDLEHVRFYGEGPDENYIDRAEGARLGIFEFEVADNFTPYLRPQECGNRIGVRWAEVTDDFGHGLRFEMEDSPFELGALHFSSEQLEASAHPDELPDPEYTFVTISARQQGVGGKDSWISTAEPQYRTPSDKPLTLRFSIEGI